MRKRLLGLFLSMVLVLGLLPTTALAGGGFALSRNEIDFGSTEEGYEISGGSTVTVTNNTGSTVGLQISGAKDYTVTIKTNTIENKGKADFTIIPKAGLSVGTYDEELTIADSNNHYTAKVSLKFTVTGGDPEPAEDASKAIQLGTSGIKDPTEVTEEDGEHYTPNSYIYFGVNSKNNGTPIKWRVLDADKANDGATAGMFLLSEYLLESS